MLTDLQKEILFLRHRLQKGLLVRDQDQKEEDMKSMSEFISKLEGYADLEVSIIRATKINKVLKAILKLNTILKEEEFNFKARSQALLDKWNKLLAVDQDVPAPTNGVKQDAKPEAEASSAGAANGVEKSASDEKPEEATEAAAPEATKAAEADDAAAPATEENPKVFYTRLLHYEYITNRYFRSRLPRQLPLNPPPNYLSLVGAGREVQSYVTTHSAAYIIDSSISSLITSTSIS